MSNAVEEWVKRHGPNVTDVIPGTVEFAIETDYECAPTLSISWSQKVTRRGPKYHGEAERRTREMTEHTTWHLGVSEIDLTAMINEIVDGT
jgi:hypothetical protein